ncbi:hypothetical protein GCM10007298_18340 [Williamsia phyllosphaerae]|uniref:Uncharacterized protein n=1 Tax=Williamsia phyllosphaerae TaxID=885042 RepID=A0ABQ1UP98_9NOCA|nr:hypothetical protein GCM10007298_18340 [Williamsia phyllosphaerae]
MSSDRTTSESGGSDPADPSVAAAAVRLAVFATYLAFVQMSESVSLGYIGHRQQAPDHDDREPVDASRPCAPTDPAGSAAVRR